jgi:hypothetical protein
LFAVSVAAQQPTTPVWQIPSPGGFSSVYRTPKVAPVHMENSRRLDSLYRDSHITLSLEDAIALALENNLELELVRYAPRLAETDLLRAEAGSALRGIPLGREGPVGLGACAGPNGTRRRKRPRAQCADRTRGPDRPSPSSMLPLSTGPAVPNFDPAIVGVSWNHTSDPGQHVAPARR